MVGAGLALAGLIGGNVNERFLIPYGLLFATAGLAYLWAFVSIEGATSNLGYTIALGLGVVGTLAFLVGLGRSICLSCFTPGVGSTSARPILCSFRTLTHGRGPAVCGIVDRYLFGQSMRRDDAARASGLFLFAVGILRHVGVQLLRMDHVLFVCEHSRRHGEAGRGHHGTGDCNLFVQWFPIIFLVILGIPVLTMRLFSEEQRTGTMEVLLTSPVSELGVVLSKFIAVLLFYMVLWTPWILCLVAFRVGTGSTFEFRPLLTFFLAVACFGAGFLAMGLFCSSLTRNQLIAAVLVLTRPARVYHRFLGQEQRSANVSWKPVDHRLRTRFVHRTYYRFGRRGIHCPKFLLFHISAAIFWLFLTVKVLESRKWR